MGRLTYINRKIDGLKAGQAVTKDLQKRYPSDKNNDENARVTFREPRDPVVELDVCGKNLTDMGLSPVAETLLKALSYDGEQGRCTRLEELCLQGNRLTVFSLRTLTRVIQVCDQDLRDLDLSDNNIIITTAIEARLWEDFLTSFQKCCVLRRLDLSGNALGPRAFEILTRAYLIEDAIDFVLPADFKDTQHEIQSPSAVMTSGLVKKTKKTCIGFDANEHAGDETSSPRAQKQKHFKQGWSAYLQFKNALLTVVPESKSPERILATSPRAGALPIYKTTKGLRSVPYIILSNTSMTNICALHLSFVVAYHHLPGRLLTRVPPPKAGTHTQQLIDYDRESQCQGIIYLPNEGLRDRSAGLKVLELAEMFRVEPLEGAAEEFPESSQTQSTSSNPPRRNSNAHSNPSLVSGVTRRRFTVIGREAEDRSVLLATNLDRARSKIQSETLGQIGVISNDLWGASLRMLCLGRQIQPRIEKVPDTKNEIPPVPKARIPVIKTHATPGFTLKSRPPPLPLSSQRDPNATLLPWGTFTTKSVRAVPATPTVIPATPLQETHLGGHVDSSLLSPNAITSTISLPLASLAMGHFSGSDPPTLLGENSAPIGPAPTRTGLKGSISEDPKLKGARFYRSNLPCQLPEDVWRRIIAFAAGADGIMSVRQQRSILTYAMDLKTVKRENEQLGLTRAHQIWKTLDATGCLSYEMVV